jgi:hypothetical protein
MGFDFSSLMTPANIKGLADAMGVTDQIRASINRFSEAINNVADKIDPKKSEPTQPVPQAAPPALPEAPAPAPQALPAEGFVLDHTGATIKIADIVAAVQQVSVPPPKAKGECANCVLVHPLTKMPTPEVCGSCMTDPARPKFIARP